MLMETISGDFFIKAYFRKCENSVQTCCFDSKNLLVAKYLLAHKISTERNFLVYYTLFQIMLNLRFKTVSII